MFHPSVVFEKRNVIGHFLSFVKVVHLYKAVIDELKTPLFFIQFGRQLVMTIIVELQPERRPGRHAQIAQSQRRRDEVEVIMQTPARDRLERGFVCFLVMPGLISRTRFHRREDMHQSRMRTALLDNLLDPAFFAECFLAEKFDGHAVFLGEAFGMGPNRLPQGLGPFRVIEDANTLGSQQPAHPFGITDTGENAGPYDAVKTRKDSLNLAGVTVDELLHHGYNLPKLTTSRIHRTVYSPILGVKTTIFMSFVAYAIIEFAPCRAASKLVTNCLLFGNRFDQPGGSREALESQKKQSSSLGRGWEGDCDRANREDVQPRKALSVRRQPFAFPCLVPARPG